MRDLSLLSDLFNSGIYVRCVSNSLSIISADTRELVMGIVLNYYPDAKLMTSNKIDEHKTEYFIDLN